MQALNKALSVLLKDRFVIDAISRLKNEVQYTSEPFVWLVLNLQSVREFLP